MKGYLDENIINEPKPNATSTVTIKANNNVENKKYSIIYANPLWKQRKKQELEKNDFISIKELKELNIKNIIDKNAILFLWVKFSLLQEALYIMHVWGFKYKTLGFSWIKLSSKNKQILLTNSSYTKENCEICLIGIKGKFRILDKNISSCIISESDEDNEKPNIIRDNIVRMCGDLPRLELFATKEIEGWDIYSNDIESSIII